MIRGCCLCVLFVIQGSVGFAQDPSGDAPADFAPNVSAQNDQRENEPAEPAADEPAADEPAADEPAADESAEAIEQGPAGEEPTTPDATAPSPEAPTSEAPTPPAAVPSTALEFSLRADQPGRLRFESESAEAQEFSAPGRGMLEPAPYRVTWTPSGGEPELLDAAWRPNGEPLRVAHRGPSFTNLLGYWLLGNGLLVGLPVSLGVFAKRDDLGAAATFSIIGVNTLVAIAGAIFMGIGDDEVVELEPN